VLAGQLDRLTAQHPAVTVQVLPAGVSPPVFTDAFTVYGFGGDVFFEEALPDIAVIRFLTGQRLIDHEDDSYQYVHAFDRIAAAALNPADSATFIKDLASGPQS
jgi:hypothetical protein